MGGSFLCYFLFLFLILRFVFLSLLPSPHLLLSSACFLTMNPLSGCCAAWDEETVCESMYHVSPQAVLLIYPALHVHFLPTSLPSCSVCMISAFLSAIHVTCFTSVCYSMFKYGSIFPLHTASFKCTWLVLWLCDVIPLQQNYLIPYSP